MIFKEGSTQNRWALMGDFSKEGVHKTDELWWVMFSKGGVHKTDGVWWVMFFKGGSTQNWWALMGDVFKGGSTQNRWGLNVFLLLLKIKLPGRLFRQIRVYIWRTGMLDVLLWLCGFVSVEIFSLTDWDPAESVRRPVWPRNSKRRTPSAKAKTTLTTPFWTHSSGNFSECSTKSTRP